jgi:hypothetical protein
MSKTSLGMVIVGLCVSLGFSQLTIHTQKQHIRILQERVHPPKKVERAIGTPTDKLPRSFFSQDRKFSEFSVGEESYATDNSFKVLGDGSMYIGTFHTEVRKEDIGSLSHFIRVRRTADGWEAYVSECEPSWCSFTAVDAIYEWQRNSYEKVRWVK